MFWGPLAYIERFLDFPDGLVVKKLPANARDIREASLIPDGEDPLVEKMATHSSILAWRIPRMEEIGYSPLGCKRVGHSIAAKQQH